MGVTLTASRQGNEGALRRIARAAGDRIEELSLSEYRLLRDRSEEDLPSAPAIWAMFGSFQRMRELALLKDRTMTDEGR